MIWLFVIALDILVGMCISVTSSSWSACSRDFLPSSWALYWPTIWDVATYVGTIGLFFFLFFPLHPLAADDFDL